MTHDVTPRSDDSNVPFLHGLKAGRRTKKPSAAESNLERSPLASIFAAYKAQQAQAGRKAANRLDVWTRIKPNLDADS